MPSPPNRASQGPLTPISLLKCHSEPYHELGALVRAHAQGAQPKVPNLGSVVVPDQDVARLRKHMHQEAAAPCAGYGLGACCAGAKIQKWAWKGGPWNYALHNAAGSQSTPIFSYAFLLTRLYPKSWSPPALRVLPVPTFRSRCMMGGWWEWRYSIPAATSLAIFSLLMSLRGWRTGS